MTSFRGKARWLFVAVVLVILCIATLVASALIQYLTLD